MVNNIPVQGDIIKINLNPKQGHEQAGYRPYLCLSNKLISDIANIAVFAPISNTTRNYPFYITLNNLSTTGKVLLDQLVAIDYNARAFNYIETVAQETMSIILSRVKLIFDMNRDGV